MERAQVLSGPPACLCPRALACPPGAGEFSIVSEGPIAGRQDLPERRWFVSQNLNKFLGTYYDEKDE